VRDLGRRGVILAVCSKNDEANALEPFAKHPEMVLRRNDIACFVANWQDKASNLRRIAETLKIGIDSLVFVDDNPAERELVRTELPMVAVPEMPDDPSEYVGTLASAGYFESLRLTDEDSQRGAQYAANSEREKLKTAVTDMDGYLRALEMQLLWRPFDKVNLARIAQLINKTNQFNLTTRRYAEADVAAMLGRPELLTFQFRLKDRFGDNGIISLLIGRREGDALWMDTWLMSCRVLGRQVEESVLNVLVSAAAEAGVQRIVGEYLPTAKNGMVREHYARLGFQPDAAGEDGTMRWSLAVADFKPYPTHVTVLEEKHERA
jgi:FkbH-like protein